MIAVLLPLNSAPDREGRWTRPICGYVCAQLTQHNTQTDHATATPVAIDRI